MGANVRVIRPFLNLAVGDVLYFNEESKLYEFKSRDEDSSIDFKSINEYAISMEPWLITDNIGKYFSEIQIEENMATKIPLDEIEPMECSKEEEMHITIAKINAESAERIAKIHAESAERIAKVTTCEPKDWGVHSDGFQGGF